MNYKEYLYCVVFLCIICLQCQSLAQLSNKARVGDFCVSSHDCGSNILYCSNNGVCLCDETRALQVVDLRNGITKGKARCEMIHCSRRRREKYFGCNIINSRCVSHFNGGSFCKCPNNAVVIREMNALGNRFINRCTETFKILGLGQYCMSPYTMCDTSRRLMCGDNQLCKCRDGFIYSFEERFCLKRSTYIAKYGSYNLGGYLQYCETYADCDSGRACLNHRCDCSETVCRQVIRTKDTCYCPMISNSMKFLFLTVVIPAIVVCSCIVGYYYYHKKRNQRAQRESAAEEMESSNLAHLSRSSQGQQYSVKSIDVPPPLPERSYSGRSNYAYYVSS